jgi:TolB-like protein/Tfp pilus assembly protein PilF
MLSTLAAIVRDEPSPLEAPEDLVRIVTRCLRKSPEARYQTMAEIKTALENAVHSEQHSLPSIAVLPFANMSRDANDEYFSDGLAEEIINLLAHVPGLKVTARTSAFAFRGKDQDITKIAEALKVRTILQGSVRRAGNRIRVTAQLINAQDGYHLWSERYDRELTDIFAVQDEIAAAIAQALQVKLSPKPTALQRHAPSVPAYEAYLKGRHYQWRATPDDVDKSKQFYLQAIELDPQFPLAYIGYGDHFLYSAASGLQPAREAMPIVRENARKALELDPALPEAHAMLGIVACHLDHDWQEAGRHFQRAVATEPVPPLVRSWYGFFYLSPSGRPQGSVEQHERALQEDPLNALYGSCLASALMLAGRPAEAERRARQVLDVDPAFQLALFAAGPACIVQGKVGYALAFGEKAHALYPQMTWPAGLLAAVHERMGDPNRAASMLASIRSGSEYGAPVGLAIYHAGRGDIDQAVEWATKAVEFGQPGPLNFVGLSLETLRSSSNWPRLAKAANLPSETI